MGIPRARRGGRKSARARRAADAATRARRARPPRVSFSRGTRRVWGWETHHTLPSRICVRVEAERDTATPTGAAAGALARRETARRSMTASRPARREVPRPPARAHLNTANAHLEIRAERTNPRPAGFRVLAVEPTGIRESAQPPRAEWSGEVFSLSHSPSPLQTTTTVSLRVSFDSARVAALSVSLSLYALTPSCRSTTGLSSGAAAA